jgi:hypothetical protein
MRQLIVLLAVLTCCEHALAMGGGHGTKPVNLSDSHLSELANRPGRVGGYWVNSNDWFYFAGDTKALNDFLRRYAEMKGTPLVLVIHPGKAPAEACVGDLFAEPYDWKLDSMYRGFTRDKTWFQKPDGGQWPGSVVIVQAWLGGNVRLDDLEVPANIEVRPGGEIGEFIKEHNKKKAECSVRQKDVLLRGAAASCRHLCLDIDEDAKVEQIGGATSSRCLRLATGKAPDARWKLTETERGHLIQAQTGKLAGWYLDFDSKNRVDVELKITRVWLYAERPNHGAEGKTSGKEEPTLGVPGGVKITGPTAANAPGPLTIDLILAEGMREVPSIWIGYEQLSKDAVRERARRLLRASPGLEVAIRADRAMPYESVAELQELLKTVGAKNVSLAVFPIGSVFAIAPGAGRDGTIRGKVIAPDMPGEPVFVTLDNEAWTNRGWLPSTSMEVAVGEMFEFRNLPAGKFIVRTGSVTAPGQDVGVAARRAEAEVIVKNKQVVEIELSFDD